MKGTIDQVEAFFEGITSAWGRVLLFFLTCWVAYYFGSAAINFTWNDYNGLTWRGIGHDIYLVPIVWIVSLIADSSHLIGLLLLLALPVLAYSIIYAEVSRVRLVSGAFLVYSWRTWYVAGGDDAGLPDDLPGLLLMMILSAIALYFLWNSLRYRE